MGVGYRDLRRPPQTSPKPSASATSPGIPAGTGTPSAVSAGCRRATISQSAEMTSSACRGSIVHPRRGRTASSSGSIGRFFTGSQGFGPSGCSINRQRAIADCVRRSIWEAACRLSPRPAYFTAIGAIAQKNVSHQSGLTAPLLRRQGGRGFNRDSHPVEEQARCRWPRRHAGRARAPIDLDRAAERSRAGSCLRACSRSMASPTGSEPAARPARRDARGPPRTRQTHRRRPRCAGRDRSRHPPRPARTSRPARRPGRVRPPPAPRTIRSSRSSRCAAYRLSASDVGSVTVAFTSAYADWRARRASRLGPGRRHSAPGPGWCRRR